MGAHAAGREHQSEAGGESIKRVLSRKAFHLASIGSMAAVAAFLPRYDALIVLAAVLLGIFLVFLGVNARPVREQREFQEEIGREDKAFPLQGTVMALVGGSFAILLFGSVWAAAGLIVLALGDGLSTLYALQFGAVKFPWGGRYADAWGVGVLAGAAGAALLVPWWVAIPASAAAQLPEVRGWSDRPVWADDNLVTPVLAAAAIAAVSWAAAAL